MRRYKSKAEIERQKWIDLGTAVGELKRQGYDRKHVVEDIRRAMIDGVISHWRWEDSRGVPMGKSPLQWYSPRDGLPEWPWELNHGGRLKDTTGDHRVFLLLKCQFEECFKNKRVGRPGAVNWQLVEEEVFRLMDDHGEFVPEDPKWNAQARLEETIDNFIRSKFDKELNVPSTIRPRVAKALKGWRTRMAGN
jgi:hypothetical protein